MTDESKNKTGWRVVAVSFIAMLIVFGIRLSFSVFFAEFRSHEGWSSESAAGIFSVSMLAFAFGSMPAGMLLDRFGPQRVFSSGAFLLGMGLFLSSQATGIRYLQLSYGLVGGLALAIMGLGPVAAVVAGWFPEKRGLTIGIAFAGTGFGALLFVPMSERLIAWFGWRGAYQALAMICLFVLLPLMAFGEKRPPVTFRRDDSGLKNLGAMVKLPAFWWLILLAFASIGPIRALTVHQVAYLEETGVVRQQAARYVGLAGFITAGAFVAWGYVSDRMGRAWVFTGGAICLMGAVGVLVWLREAQTAPLLLGYSLLIALGEGSRSGQTTALASDTFHDRGLGLINGTVGAMFGLGAAFVPWLMGRLRDTTGSYIPGLEVVAAINALGVFSFWMVLYFRPRRRYDHNIDKERVLSS